MNNDIDLMNPFILQKLLEWTKEDKMIKFYQSPSWRSARRLALKRDKEWCQSCMRSEGVYTKGNTVHHIKSVKKAPLLALCLSNLETICPSCHNKEHPEKFGNYQTTKKEFVNEERW